MAFYLQPKNFSKKGSQGYACRDFEHSMPKEIASIPTTTSPPSHHPGNAQLEVVMRLYYLAPECAQE